MPVTGLEPVRGCPRGILSPLRLPIPPHRQTYKYVDDGFPSNGTYRARTYDPLLVRQMLSQLSYDPITTQKRLELSTSAVTGRRSNQLSHWAR